MCIRDRNGNPGTGVWYFDDIGLYHDGTVTVPDAEATETEATFDPQDPTDIIFTIITNGHVLTGITEDGNALQQGTDYAVNGSQFRFNRSYLEDVYKRQVLYGWFRCAAGIGTAVCNDSQL